MQGGIFDEHGLFITLKMLDSAFNLRSEALNSIFARMISTYGIFLQRTNNSSLSTNILTGNNTNFATGLGDWSGTGVTWDSSSHRMKIDATSSSPASISLNLLSKGNGKYRITFDYASASVYHVTFNGIEVSGSGGATWTGEVILNSSNLANIPLTISGIAGTYLYVNNIILKAIDTYVYSTEGLCVIADTNHITVPAFSAIVKDSDSIVKSIQVETSQTVDLTGKADGTWKILAQIKQGYYEDGTITLTNGSKNVAGVNTKFTKRLGPKMQLVILDSTDGNNGIYEVETITNDTGAVLKDTYTGTTEGSLPYSIGGKFPDPNIYPATTAGYRCYLIENYEFVVTQSAAGTNQIYLCDAIISGGAIIGIVDHRTALKLAPHTHLVSDITDLVIKAGNILGTGTGKAVDGTTIGVNENGELELLDSALTASKISHNNNARKIIIPFSCAGTSNAWAVIAGVTTSTTIGFCFGRAGSITKITMVNNSGGAVTTENYAYGDKPFVALDKIAMQYVFSPFEHMDVYLAGARVYEYDANNGYQGEILGTLEVEFDN